MRQDYQTLTTITLAQKKDYLIQVCQDSNIQDMLYQCMTHKQFEHLMSSSKINKRLFICALHHLYQADCYDELEYRLIQMNQLFYYQSYSDLKKQLFIKLSKKTITINEYCIMRHLIDFRNMSFNQFIKILNEQYEVEAEECARICLLEDQYHLAYQYLKQLPDCQDETLLDLLCSYSVYDYISLIRHYTKRKKGYQLAPSH